MRSLSRNPTRISPIRGAVFVICCYAMSICVYCSGQSAATLTDSIQDLRNGNYSRAVAELRELSAANPRDPEILNNLAIAFQLQNDSDNAIRTFERVLALKRLPSAVAMLAQDYCRDHEFQKAAPLLHEAKGSLADLNIDSILGPCFLEANLPEDAVVAYENLVNAGSQPEDENAANLVRAYLDLSRKLFSSISALPGGEVFSEAVEKAKADGSLDGSAVLSRAYQQTPYFKESTPLDEGIRLLSAHRSEPAFLFLLGSRCADKAAELFDQMQDKWPDAIALQQLTAELQDLNKDREGAIETYEEILAKHPDAPPAVHFALGLLYSERQRWEDALQQYRAISSEAAGSLYLKQRIADALLHLGRNEEVMKLLEGAVHDPLPAAWALRDYGEAAEGLGQKQTALVFLQRASKRDPEDFPLHYHLLHVYSALGMNDAAKTELEFVKQRSERAALSTVDLQKTHQETALRLERSHQFTQAETEWRAILAVAPDSPEAVEGLSNNLIVQKKYLGVISLLEDPRVARDRSPQEIANLGIAYAASGNLDSSISVLRDGFNTFPESSLIATALGDRLIQMGRYREAAAVLRLAYERPDANSTTSVMYLKALIESDPNSATPIAGKLLATKPDNWEVQYLNGVLDQKMEKLSDAEIHLKRAIALNPGSAICHAQLALVLARQNDLIAAKGEQQKAVALGDGSREVTATLAEVQRSLSSEGMNNGGRGSHR